MKSNKEITEKLDYLIGQLNGSQTDAIIKEELKSFITSTRLATLEEVERVSVHHNGFLQLTKDDINKLKI